MRLTNRGRTVAAVLLLTTALGLDATMAREAKPTAPEWTCYEDELMDPHGQCIPADDFVRLPASAWMEDDGETIRVDCDDRWIACDDEEYPDPCFDEIGLIPSDGCLEQYGHTVLHP